MSEKQWKYPVANYYFTACMKWSFVFSNWYDLYMWGDNTYGQLAQNDTVKRSSPIRVGNGYWNYNSISRGSLSYTQLAVDTNSSALYGWGYNNYGNVGDNSVTNRSSPVLIDNSNNWSKTATSLENSFAITSTGRLYGWGRNTYGSVGDNTTVSRSTPVAIGTDNWSEISCGSDFTVGIKSDGTMWSWGLGSAGQLGHGGTTTYSSPVQIGTGNNWSKVSCGVQHTLALKSDGTIWSWGDNTNGQLGDGTNTNRSSPVQAGSNTNWTKIMTLYSNGPQGSMAINTSGSLYCWGNTLYSFNLTNPTVALTGLIDFSGNSGRVMTLRTT